MASNKDIDDLDGVPTEDTDFPEPGHEDMFDLTDCVCDECHGRGWVEAEGVDDMCGACDGNGVIEYDGDFFDDERP